MEYYVKDSNGSESAIIGEKEKRKAGKVLYSIYTCFTVAFICFVVGLCLLGVGSWIWKSEEIWGEIVRSKLINHGAYLLIASSGGLILVSALAMYGSIKENKCILIFFVVMCCVLFCTFVVTGILGAVALKRYPEELRWTMRDLLQNRYGVEPLITDIIDHLQENRECCAVEDHSFGVYRNSKWYSKQQGLEEADRPLVPITCCVRDQYYEYEDADLCQTNRQGPPYIISGRKNKALIMRGCFGVIIRFLKNKAANLTGLGFAAALAMIPAAVAFIYLLLLLRKERRAR